MKCSLHDNEEHKILWVFQASRLWSIRIYCLAHINCKHATICGIAHSCSSIKIQLFMNNNG